MIVYQQQMNVLQRPRVEMVYVFTLEIQRGVIEAYLLHVYHVVVEIQADKNARTQL